MTDSGPLRAPTGASSLATGGYASLLRSTNLERQQVGLPGTIDTNKLTKAYIKASLVICAKIEKFV
jgi:hypothetical protein